jgi:hypothetical protein
MHLHLQTFQQNQNLIEKMALASPATAFANRVFPVPGGPTSKAPLEFYHQVCVFLWFSETRQFPVFLLGPF